VSEAGRIGECADYLACAIDAGGVGEHGAGHVDGREDPAAL
jgi:hypothetical protein